MSESILGPIPGLSPINSSLQLAALTHARLSDLIPITTNARTLSTRRRLIDDELLRSKLDNPFAALTIEYAATIRQTEFRLMVMIVNNGAGLEFLDILNIARRKLPEVQVRHRCLACYA